MRASEKHFLMSAIYLAPVVSENVAFGIGVLLFVFGLLAMRGEWRTAQAYDVAQAGIDAVTQWANQPKDTK